MKHEEHNEQVKFVMRVNNFLPDLLMFAVPNGGKREMREAVRLKAEGVLPGVPDIVIARAAANYHGLYLEFKTAKGRTSDKQKAVIAKLIEEGYACCIVRSCEEAWDALNRYLDKKWI